MQELGTTSGGVFGNNILAPNSWPQYGSICAKLLVLSLDPFFQVNTMLKSILFLRPLIRADFFRMPFRRGILIYWRIYITLPAALESKAIFLSP